MAAHMRSRVGATCQFRAYQFFRFESVSWSCQNSNIVFRPCTASRKSFVEAYQIYQSATVMDSWLRGCICEALLSQTLRQVQRGASKSGDRLKKEKKKRKSFKTLKYPETKE